MVCPLLPMEDQKMGRMDGARWLVGHLWYAKRQRAMWNRFANAAQDSFTLAGVVIQI